MPPITPPARTITRSKGTFRPVHSPAAYVDARRLVYVEMSQARAGRRAWLGSSAASTRHSDYRAAHAARPIVYVRHPCPAQMPAAMPGGLMPCNIFCRCAASVNSATSKASRRADGSRRRRSVMPVLCAPDYHRCANRCSACPSENISASRRRRVHFRRFHVALAADDIIMLRR